MVVLVQGRDLRSHHHRPTKSRNEKWSYLPANASEGRGISVSGNENASITSSFSYEQTRPAC